MVMFCTYTSVHLEFLVSFTLAKQDASQVSVVVVSVYLLIVFSTELCNVT